MRLEVIQLVLRWMAIKINLRNSAREIQE
jgi:hypothetical protein